MDNKVCRKCGNERQLSEFSKDRSRPDGLRNSCKFCDRAHENSPEVRARKNAYQREKARAWYKKYRDSKKGQAREKRHKKGETYKKHKDSDRYRAYMRASVQKREAIKKQLPATFTEHDWTRALEFFNQACAYCGKPEKLTQDHFTPISRNGAYTSDNIVPACQSCNSRKGNRIPENWCLSEVYDHIQKYFQTLRS